MSDGAECGVGGRQGIGASRFSDDRTQVPVSVLHVTDSLDAGGLERVAVNLANAMQDRYRIHFCTTRGDGALAGDLGAGIGRLSLKRTSRFSPGAILRFRRYLKEHRVRIIHAHGTAAFLAASARWWDRRTVVLWHVHAGWLALEGAPFPYRLLGMRLDGAVAVNQALKAWVGAEVLQKGRKAWYVPNFVVEPDAGADGPSLRLPGEAGFRIVCVGNLRPEKGHPALLEAMRVVVREMPKAHLLLVGAGRSDGYQERFVAMCRETELANNVTWLGARADVPLLLRHCQVGVLSSLVEGLPVALIEYGMAGLGAVATRVGECPEVLGGGSCGIVVPPDEPAEMAAAILRLLRGPGERAELGQKLKARVRAWYSKESAVEILKVVYSELLAGAG